jgi:hypothetical protein
MGSFNSGVDINRHSPDARRNKTDNSRWLRFPEAIVGLRIARGVSVVACDF